MNRIFWGGSLRGVEVAAHAYFNKSAKELTLEQSALLVGIIRAPNKFSPFRHLERAKLQRDWVLEKMVENNAITQDEADLARQQPLKVSSPNNLREGSSLLGVLPRLLPGRMDQASGKKKATG